jgi:TP901 family phage tail tape measure protein
MARNIPAGGAYVVIGITDKYSRELKVASQKIRAFGIGITKIGAAMTAAAAAMATPLVQAAKVWGGFEASMSRVKALTAATGEQFEKLNDQAQDLGKTTVFSASQAADAMSVLALAGFDVNQIMEATPTVLDLAAAGQIDLATSADIAAKAMFGLGLEASDLGHVVDVLAKAMSTANTDIVMVGNALAYVGPIAKTAGVSLEDIVAAIQILSNAGIQGEMAGTTLRGAILSLSAPTAEATATLKRLNVEVQDSAGNLRPLADIIDGLANATAKMGTAQKLGTLSSIFDARQSSGFAELVAQGGDKLRGFSRALRDSGGTAARIASVQMDNLRGDMDELSSAVEAVQIAIGKGLNPDLRALSQWATQATSNIAAFAEKNGELIASVGKMIAAIGALGLLLVATGGTISLLGLGLAGVAVGMSTLVAIVGTLLSPLGLLTAGFVGLSAAALKSSGLMDDAWKMTRDALDALGKDAVATFSAIGNAIAGGDLKLAMEIATQGMEVAWLDMTRGLREAWIEFQQWFGNITTDIFAGFDALVKTSLSKFKHAMIDVKDASNPVLATWRKVVDAVGIGILRAEHNVAGMFGGGESFDLAGARQIVDANQKADFAKASVAAAKAHSAESAKHAANMMAIAREADKTGKASKDWADNAKRALRDSIEASKVMFNILAAQAAQAAHIAAENAKTPEQRLQGYIGDTGGMNAERQKAVMEARGIPYDNRKGVIGEDSMAAFAASRAAYMSHSAAGAVSASAGGSARQVDLSLTALGGPSRGASSKSAEQTTMERIVAQLQALRDEIKRGVPSVARGNS